MNGWIDVMGSTKRIVMKARNESLYFLSSWFILLPRMGVLSQAQSSRRGAMDAGFHRVWPSFVFYGIDMRASIGLPALFRSFFHLSSIDER